MRDLVEKALAGEEAVVPAKAMGPDGWCLYSDMPGIDEAGAELAAAAQKIVDLSAAVHRDLAEIL